MEELELEKSVFCKGWLELDTVLNQMFMCVEREQYSEAYVQAGDASKLARGLQQVIKRLERIKKGR